VTDVTGGAFDRSLRVRYGRRGVIELPRSVASQTPVTDGFHQLLSLVRTGNAQAWAQLYAELAGPVLGYLRARGAAEPDDLLSEVFLHVVRGVHSFDGDRQQFRSWVFTIAHRRLIDERRARGKRPVELRDDLETEVLAEDPAILVIDRLADEEILRMLDALTSEQRDVLLLRVLAGLTIDEIARVIGKSPGAVKALQRRGFLVLQETLSVQ
jgi:RNA polymerase sigma-70 factor (ECF subfamily)